MYEIKKNLEEINFIYERSNKEAGVDDHPVGLNTAKMDYLRQTLLKDITSRFSIYIQSNKMVYDTNRNDHRNKVLKSER